MDVQTQNKTATADLRWRNAMVLTQKGDREAYKDLLMEFSLYLRKFILKRFGKLNAADDIVQETLIGIHKARHTYDPKLSFTTWALAICRYKSADYFRRLKTRPEISFENAEFEFLNYYDVHNRPYQDDTTEEENLKKLKDAVAELPETQQKILQWMKFEGRTVKETAQKLQMSEGAVRVSAHRAYSYLRKLLKK